MRYYHPQKQYQYFCGVDLHTITMYLCVQNQAGRVQLHKNIRSRPGPFLAAIEPYRDGLVVACECVFCWYWLADLCRSEGIEFVLGHALYMKAISILAAKLGRAFYFMMRRQEAFDEERLFAAG